MVGENEFRCSKPNYLKNNPPPGNIIEKFVKLGNYYYVETFRRLERVVIIEPLEYDANYDVMKAFRIILPSSISPAMYHLSTFQII